jgi:3-hydroxyacyl-CoA dehydrogenase
MSAGRIAIVGTGLIGRGWAIVFARAGYETALYDAAEGAVQRALEAIGHSLRDLEAMRLIDSAAAAAAHLRPCTRLEEALEGVAYAQESAPEERDLKRAVFEAMDRAAPPDAVLGSSCSAMPGSTFLGGLPGAGRCLIAHPANPPYLLPVVELVPTPETSAAALARCRALMEAVGQVPVTLRKEVPGFVMNRMQIAAVNEAMSLVAGGVMDPDDVDRTMRYSIGMRWAFMGPFETMELNAAGGFEDYATRYRAGYETVGRDLRVGEPWDQGAIEAIEAARRARLPKAQVPNRHAWRDRRLMALLRHLKDADRELGA